MTVLLNPHRDGRHADHEDLSPRSVLVPAYYVLEQVHVGQNGDTDTVTEDHRWRAVVISTAVVVLDATAAAPV